MTIITTTKPALNRIEDLRVKEARTCAAIHQLVAKITKLQGEKDLRVQALQTTRHRIAAALLASSSMSARHEQY